MLSERKKGLIMLEGANPMTFVESSEEPSEIWTLEQEAAVKAVSLAIKSYIKTTEALIPCRTTSHSPGTLRQADGTTSCRFTSSFISWDEVG